MKDRHGGGAKVILSRNPKNHTKAGPLIAMLYRKEKLCAAWSQNRVNPGKLAGQGRRAPENAGRPAGLTPHTKIPMNFSFVGIFAFCRFGLRDGLTPSFRNAAYPYGSSSIIFFVWPPVMLNPLINL